MATTGKMYVGQFSSYEEYYAFGSNYADVKDLLWRMYRRNCDTVTADDKRIFESEAWVQVLEAMPAPEVTYGFNTYDSGRIFGLKNNRLIDLEGTTVTEEE
jgi:hypothetical protein